MIQKEHSILLWLQKHRTETGNKFWWLITKLGYSKMWFPICALLTLLPVGNSCRIQLWSALAVQALLVHVILKKGCRRQRPFEACPEIIPVGKRPRDRSFPSGHTLRGWAAALLLLEINPDRAEELLTLGYQYGQSRVISGYHWQSDVDASRLVAAAAVAKLHTSKRFDKQMKRAKKEFARLAK